MFRRLPSIGLPLKKICKHVLVGSKAIISRPTVGKEGLTIVLGSLGYLSKQEHLRRS